MEISHRWTDGDSRRCDKKLGANDLGTSFPTERDVAGGIKHLVSCEEEVCFKSGI